MATPILKWAGGKRQLLSEITAQFPTDFNQFHEPFFGGGAIFFAIEPQNGTINDLNSRLVNFYKVIKENPDKLIEENKKHRDSEEYYYKAREEFNNLHKLEDKNNNQRIREASLLLYLNRTCFNGLYRENQSGEFNVPRGSYTNPDWIQEDAVQETHEVLQTTNIHNEDFEYIRGIAEQEDLVYFDPPYQPVSTTADFNTYHADGFTRDDQRRLRDLALDLSKADVYVVISNSPPVAELYKEFDYFNVEVVPATRAINSDGENRGEVAEILITNIPASQKRQQKLSDFK